MRPLQLLAFLSIGLIWGASFMFVKVMTDGGLSPLAVGWTRTAGGVFMVAVLLATGRRPPRSSAY
jgi:drug/metabolite transporter (DMT)-like permease